MKTLSIPIAIFVIAGCASAGPSRDSLMSQGAKPLTGTELKSTVSGAEVSGESLRSVPFRWDLRADGSVSGEATSAREGGSAIAGKWIINDRGQLCYQQVTTTSVVYGTYPWPVGCEDWFKLGADYYAIENGKTMKRSVKKN